MIEIEEEEDFSLNELLRTSNGRLKIQSTTRPSPAIERTYLFSSEPFNLKSKLCIAEFHDVDELSIDDPPKEKRLKRLSKRSEKVLEEVQDSDAGIN